MLLKEIKSVIRPLRWHATEDKIENFRKRGLIIELEITNTFTSQKAREVVSKLGGKVIDEEVYGADIWSPARSMFFDVLFPTEQEKEHGEELLLGLSRRSSRPKFDVQDASHWTTDDVQRLIDKLPLDENINPGSGSPIRESIPDRFVIDFFPDDEDESTIRRLHTRVENMLGQMVPPESVQIFYPETEAFIISASIPVRSREEAENIIKKVRRLSREKPRFRWSYDETQLSDIYDDTFENVNPGSGSPIRAGSMDLTPLSDKQKMQLVSRKGRYWRMSVRELKDALMQHKGNSREVSRINQVLKAKREKREELSKITQPIDSWRGGGGY